MRKLILLFLLTLSISASATDVLVVKQNDGDTSWAISTINEITFDGNGVKLAFTDGQSVYYAKDDFNMLQFDITPSGINSIEDKKAFSIKNNVISANAETSGIQVYSLNGTLVATSNSKSLNISNLSAGSYIVKADKLITKIVKK
jgi:hypothetical protein